MIEYEYQRHRTTSVGGACTAAEAAENKSRNRYWDVLPYDHTRVCLRRDDGDYINASHLSNRPGELPAWQYIVTQV